MGACVSTVKCGGCFIVIGSVLFHFVSPWWTTPLASNWQQMDDTRAYNFSWGEHCTLATWSVPVKAELVSKSCRAELVA